MEYFKSKKIPSKINPIAYEQPAEYIEEAPKHNIQIPKAMDFEIIFEDADIIAVNKPSGLLVIPDRFRKELLNLRNLLEMKYGGIFVVHRLDRETSGVTLFAKNAEAHRLLNGQFTDHTIKKIYLALVCGIPDHEAGTLKFPLAPHPRKPGTMVVSEAGKISITEYRVAEKFLKYSLVEARPLTGRTHQVRIHLAAYGHPLAVDRIYGSGEPLRLSSFKPGYKPSATEERPLIDRLTLHAEKITFHHPATNAEVTLTAPLPQDFELTLKQLRKNNRS